MSTEELEKLKAAEPHLQKYYDIIEKVTLERYYVALQKIAVGGLEILDSHSDPVTANNSVRGYLLGLVQVANRNIGPRRPSNPRMVN